MREVRTATSYQSQNALAAHFGLGGATAERLAVRWPAGGQQGEAQGARQTFLRPPPGHRLRLVSPPPTAPEAPR